MPVPRGLHRTPNVHCDYRVSAGRGDRTLELKLFRRLALGLAIAQRNAAVRGQIVRDIAPDSAISAQIACTPDKEAEEIAKRIAADPQYGRIVCFCERVTAGEIRDAYLSPVPPRDLNGLRRRTRAMKYRHTKKDYMTVARSIRTA